MTAQEQVTMMEQLMCLLVDRLMHIEQGLPDPTTDQSFHLVCRGI